MSIDKHNYLVNGYVNELAKINNILFTSREVDVISCLVNIRGTSKISSILNIAPRTTETHIANIKRKIEHGSREGIIDTIEKSGKSHIVRQHYQNLLIQADFQKKLKSICGLTIKAPTCYFFNDYKENQKSIIFAIQNHLKLADIKLIVLTDRITAPKEGEHFIYTISNNNFNSLIISNAIKQALISPNYFTFLCVEQISFDVINKLGKIKYIDFTKQNYYLTIFEILQKLLPDVDLSKVILQLNYKPIDNQQNTVVVTKNEHLEKSINYADFLKSNIQKILLIIGLLVLFAILTMFGSQKMNFKQNTEHKLHLKNEKINITSYMPEILTGHESFIGREKELQQIHNEFAKNNIIIITGCAGIGKSSLAIEYGKHYKQNKIIRYFHSASKTKIDQQYRELAQELNINVDQQSTTLIMQLVHSKLGSMQDKLLFIFDNIDHYDDAKEYLTNLPINIQVIITTRQPILITNKTHIALAEFNNNEAVKYLKCSLQDRLISDKLLYELLENIGTLPYDVKCIAAYFIENPTINNNTALRKIGKQIQNRLFKEFIINPAPTNQQAWKILQYSAYLDPDFIPTIIIKEIFPQNIALSLAAIKKLETLSLISIIRDQNDQVGFKIHRKLQKNIQYSANIYQKYSINKNKLILHLLSIFDQLFPELTFNPNIQQNIATSLQPHIEKFLNLEIINQNITTKTHKTTLANLYYKLARYYSAVNVDYKQSLKYGKIALEVRLTLYKNNHPDLANSYNDIGVMLRKSGHTKEGLYYLKKGLQIRKKLYTGIHRSLADSFHTVGSAYNQNGEPAKGLEYAKIALHMNKQLYSDNHYEIGSSLNLVGISYLDLGNLEKSLKYFKAGLKMFNEIIPINHERIASLESNIAYNYNKLGDYKKALVHATAAVNLFKKAYPDGHPKAIYSLDDLGDSLIRNNKIDQALETLHQALSLIEKFGMDKHCITAFVLHDLGQGYLKQGSYQTAVEYGTKAVELRRELYNDIKKHHELAESLDSLGDINIMLGNKKKALDLYQESLDMYLALSLEHLSAPNEIKQKINKLYNGKTPT